MPPSSCEELWKPTFIFCGILDGSLHAPGLSVAFARASLSGEGVLAEIKRTHKASTA